jgi:hypothetical protein
LQWLMRTPRESNDGSKVTKRGHKHPPDLAPTKVVTSALLAKKELN